MKLLLLSVLMLGHAVANRNGFHDYSMNNHGATVSAPATPALGESCTATLKNSSMITGGKVAFSFMIPSPTLALAGTICCSSANGNWYTNVDFRPSKKYPGQRDYICTVYIQSGSVLPQIVPGNSSTSAGKSYRPPPPDPKCAQKETKVACLGTAPSGSPCAWTGDRCSYVPPLHCGNFGPKTPLGPFCVGIDLAALPFPSGAAGRTLGAFNWTAGTVGPQQEKVFVQPAQVLQLGNTTWFSISVDLASGFAVCVQYNELSKDGHSADPNTGFSACAKFGGGMIDLTRGTSSNLQSYAGLGASAGWTEKGYQPSAGTPMWGYFMFWSNTTNTTTA